MSRPGVQTFILLLLIISLKFISSSSTKSGRRLLVGHVVNANPEPFPATDQVRKMMIELNAVLEDYEKPGPNKNHQPPGKVGR